MEYELYVNKTIIKKYEVVISAHNPTGEVSTVQVYISPPKHDVGYGAGYRGRFDQSLNLSNKRMKIRLIENAEMKKIIIPNTYC